MSGDGLARRARRDVVEPVAAVDVQHLSRADAVEDGGFIAGEQLTPGAPWRIRVTDELRSQFVDEAPRGWVPMWDAMKTLGVSRQTVFQRVKRGELRAMHLRSGRRKGLRIELPEAPEDTLLSLFDRLDETGGSVTMSPRSLQNQDRPPTAPRR